MVTGTSRGNRVPRRRRGIYLIKAFLIEFLIYSRLGKIGEESKKVKGNLWVGL